MALSNDTANAAGEANIVDASDAQDLSSTPASTSSPATISPTQFNNPYFRNDTSRSLASTSSSVTVSAHSQTTTLSPNPKISIREYTLWKALGITPYTAYLVWKGEHIDVDSPDMIKLKDRPHLRERLEVAKKIVAEELEKENKMVKTFRDVLWGTQFV
ncbi:hypothetical protein IQ06DRAFT_366384 [Phaeosphaeriaceae sp. SRC1lsM3a]|jgi:hypothetical protein|nr:hypothetical protein IQ06DRAFT_366384 [Stagonospora sp. SRC1lsM3a]